MLELTILSIRVGYWEVEQDRLERDGHFRSMQECSIVHSRVDEFFSFHWERNAILRRHLPG